MSYLDEARARTSRRKSPWNLVLIPAVAIAWVTIGLVTMRVLAALHAARYPLDPSWRTARGIGPILTSTGSLFVCLPVAMLAANFAVSLIPRARHTFEQEALPFPETSYARAQSGLLRFSAIIVPVALALAMAGVVMQWESR